MKNEYLKEIERKLEKTKSDLDQLTRFLGKKYFEIGDYEIFFKIYGSVDRFNDDLREASKQLSLIIDRYPESDLPYYNGRMEDKDFLLLDFLDVKKVETTSSPADSGTVYMLENNWNITDYKKINYLDYLFTIEKTNKTK